MLSILVVGVVARALESGLTSSPLGPFTVTSADDGPAALAAVAAQDFDALVFPVDAFDDVESAVRRLALQSAVLMVVADLATESLVMWSAAGAEDVVASSDVSAPAFAARLRAAIERKRFERESRKDYATDLATGLPHQQQLVEHMSQLLALREREPAPMAVLVLRIEGFATTEARFGAHASDSLRRKIAVRLRTLVRASDVVAALDDETFAVLLGSLLAPTDAERVAAKLTQSLLQPFSVGGVAVAVAVATGIGEFPADGTQPDVLLRKAIGMALDASAQGRVGMANFHEAGARPLDAANDE